MSFIETVWNFFCGWLCLYKTYFQKKQQKSSLTKTMRNLADSVSEYNQQIQLTQQTMQELEQEELELNQMYEKKKEERKKFHELVKRKVKTGQKLLPEEKMYAEIMRGHALKQLEEKKRREMQEEMDQDDDERGLLNSNDNEDINQDQQDQIIDTSKDIKQFNEMVKEMKDNGVIDDSSHITMNTTENDIKQMIDTSLPVMQ